METLLDIETREIDNSGIRRELREDGICELIFDRKGSSANIFDEATLDALEKELRWIEAQTDLKGLILSSAKPKIFVAGADLKTLGNADEATLARMIEKGQNVFNTLAALPVPTCAAIRGACAGGGYELALACDHRVASDDRSTKIGLPETKLGILPAWGGSTRLPRLLGLVKSLQVILGGKLYAAKHARKIGLVDDVVPKEHLEEVAKRFLAKGKCRPPKLLFYEKLPGVKLIIGSRTRHRVLNKTRGHYPAVATALEVVVKNFGDTLERGLERERNAVAGLMKTSATRNLVRIFLLQERARRTNVLSKNTTSPKPILTTAVIGSGIMGSGIAHWITSRKLSVILKDVALEPLHHGVNRVERLYGAAKKRRLLNDVEIRERMDLLKPTVQPVSFSNTDLVIEAATENMDLKVKIFQDLESRSSEETVLATNTSALSVTELSASLKHPERVVGLHFFNPVHRMQLVEVIRGKNTDPEVLQRAIDFTKSIGKLPVVVNDSPGFIVNRILMPYLMKAVRIFDAGTDPNVIDEAMLDFGMPMGPLRLLDEVGNDVALHVAKTLSPDEIPELMERIVADGALGRKAGRGFYRYEKGKSTGANDMVWTMRKGDRSKAPFAISEMLSHLMVEEAQWCLNNHVAEEEDIDFAMIMGAGFAPFRGGPLTFGKTERKYS